MTRALALALATGASVYVLALLIRTAAYVAAGG